MKKFILSVLAFIALSAVAQKNKDVPDSVSATRTLSSSFTAITVSDGIELYLTEGNEAPILVSAAEQKYLDRFKTEVDHGVLKLYFDYKGINWAMNINRKLKAYVSYKTLDKLNASGGATVEAVNTITVPSLAMSFTSGSHFKGKVDIKDLSVDQNSGSGIAISGKADKIKVEGSSGSIFKGYDLAVDYCDAKSTSGAGVHITINKELTAKANSGGGIRYKGEAMIKDVNVSSGGVVKREK